MKNFYTLVFCLFLSISGFAQVDGTFVFTDSDGNLIPDGTTITVNNYEIDEFTETLMFPSGLLVKNNSAENANAGMIVNITSLDSGMVQHCFPGSCQTMNATGSKTIINAQGGIKAGESASIQSEWLPDTKGACSVTYTILKLRMTKPMPPTFAEEAQCATVTVNYVYDDNSKDIAGIKDVQSSESEVQDFYNLAGQKIASDYKGVVIKNGKKYLAK